MNAPRSPIPLSTLEFPFPWAFVREHYSEHYLASRVPESDVQDAILKLLRTYHVDAIAIDAGGRRERGRLIRRSKAVGFDVSKLIRGGIGSEIPAGHSDLAATLAPEGRSLYIEVKAPAWIAPGGTVLRDAGIPSVEQLDFLLSKQERGAIVLVAYSIDDVANYLGTQLQYNLDSLRAGRHS